VRDILFGSVMHRRLRPAQHRFVYPVFGLLLPLDRLDQAAMRRSARTGATCSAFRYATTARATARPAALDPRPAGARRRRRR
jgi:DUF1365 family protein